MVMNINRFAWEEETKNRINEARNKQKYHEGEASHWREYADALSKALDMQKQPVNRPTDIAYSVNVDNIKSQSIRETLTQIAKANDGVLIVKDAVTILVDAKMFMAREKARNSIYANIYNNRKYFEKDSPGIYRLKNIQNIMLPLNS